MRLVSLLALLLLPLTVHADPVFTPAVIAWVSANALVIAQVVLTIGVSIYGSAQARRQAANEAENARLSHNAGLQDRTITRVATEAPQVYAYGRTRVGSAVVGIFSSGDKDQYKHLVCIHAAHECDAIEEVYIAGKALGTLDIDGNVVGGDYFTSRTENNVEIHTEGVFTLAYMPINTTPSVDAFGVQIRTGFSVTSALQQPDDSGEYTRYVYVPVPYTLVGQTVTLTGGAYPGGVKVGYQYATGTSRVRVRKHLGTASDPADATLLAEAPSKWTPSAVLRGYCYTVVRLDLNQAEFQGGIPSVEVLLRGKKLYDVRTSTTYWSQNPALVIYDYLTSPMCGVASTDIPSAQLITAANACDYSDAIIVKRYTFNGTVTADQDQSHTLEKMAQSMAGGIVATTWQITAGVYVAPVMALTQADIVGTLAITPGVSDADLFNGVKGQYISGENSYVATDYKPYQNATYVTADGGKEKWNNIDFPFTDSLQRVTNLSRIFTEDQRNGFTLKAEFSLKTWSLQVGDRVTFTSAFFGQSAKIYRVTDKKYSPSSAVELTLKEDASSIWDLADATVVDSTPNTNLPNPFAITPLAYITCASGTNVLLKQADGTIVSRILVTWPLATTQAVLTNGTIELEYQVVGATVWQKLSVTGSEVQAYLLPVNDGIFYTVRARCVNPYVNVKSDWAYATHQVVGKTASPTDVPWFNIEGNTLSWGTVNDIDLAGYVIRYHYGLNRSWGDAHPLHTGVLTQSPYTPDSLPQGQITLMIRAIDTSNNLSAVIAYIQTAFGNVIVANVVETIDFKALGYPGTYSTGIPQRLGIEFTLGVSRLAYSPPTVIGGVLKASSIANFYGVDGSNFYSQYDTTSFYNDYFGAMVYETTPITPTKAEVGSNLTLNTLLTGDALFIEYRASGSNPMYSALDAEVFYGADTSNFYGVDPAYQPWPGQIVTKNLQYQFRFSAGQSIIQGTLDTCKAVIDVPDILEKLNNIVISSSGTRLPITKSYNVIQNVQLTLEADGGTAFKPEIVDKDPILGPLVKCRDASGALVSGTIDAVIQGY